MANQKATPRRMARRTPWLRHGLRKAPLVEQAERVGQRALREVTKRVANLLDPLPIATRRDLARVDRRLTQLTRKLRNLEKRPRTSRRARRTPARRSAKRRVRKGRRYPPRHARAWRGG